MPSVESQKRQSLSYRPRPGFLSNFATRLATAYSHPHDLGPNSIFDFSFIPFAMSRLSIFAGILFALQLTAQPVDPYAHSDQNPYYGNPFEPVERRARDEADQRDQENDPEAKSTWKRLFGSRIYDEVFDTPLPGISQDKTLRFRFNPRFSDLFRNDFIRWPVGVRYNFNTHLEGQFDLGIYTGNPFQSGDGIGFYDIEPGFKYTIRRFLESEWSMAYGLRTRIPFADPPVGVIDGYARYSPFVSFSRELTYQPGVLGYVNIRYELVGDTPFTANPETPEPRDRIFLAPGLIFYPGKNLRYGVEFEYRTNALSLSTTSKRPSDYEGPPTREDILAYETIHEFSVSTSVTWFPSKETRKGIFIPGNWDAGLRLEIPVIDRTGEDIELSLRFRWYYNYRKFLSRDLPQLFRRGLDDED